MVDSDCTQVYSLPEMNAEEPTAALIDAHAAAMVGGMADLSGEYITPAEAAEVVGVSKRRIYQFIEEDRIDFIKFGRFFLIRKDSLDNVKDRTPGYPRGKSRRARGKG